MADGMSPRASLRVGAVAGSGAGIGSGMTSPRTRRSGELSTGSRLGGGSSPGSPICRVGSGEAQGKRWRLSTYPSHVADAEYPVDDVLVDVCGDELHLDGPVAPGGLLRPVLHAELGRGHRESQGQGWGGC